MSATSDHAELVTLRSSLEDLTQRAVAVGDTYRNTDGSGIAADLETAERALITARRAFDRAIKSLAPRIGS